MAIGRHRRTRRPTQPPPSPDTDTDTAPPHRANLHAVPPPRTEPAATAAGVHVVYPNGMTLPVRTGTRVAATIVDGMLIAVDTTDGCATLAVHVRRRA